MSRHRVRSSPWDGSNYVRPGEVDNRAIPSCVIGGCTLPGKRIGSDGRAYCSAHRHRHSNGLNIDWSEAEVEAAQLLGFTFMADVCESALINVFASIRRREAASDDTRSREVCRAERRAYDMLMQRLRMESMKAESGAAFEAMLKAGA